MNTNPDTQLVLNPALRIIRSTNDEIIVRFGSRGRSSRRISDTKRRGILSDIGLFIIEGVGVVCGVRRVVAG